MIYEIEFINGAKIDVGLSDEVDILIDWRWVADNLRYFDVKIKYAESMLITLTRVSVVRPKGAVAII